MNEECSYCGAAEAKGWAWINDLRFCHSDELIADCYQLAQWAEETEAWLEWMEEDGD